MVHIDERPFIEPFTKFLNAVHVPFFTKKLNAVHAIVHDFERRSERRSIERRSLRPWRGLMDRLLLLQKIEWFINIAYYRSVITPLNV